MASLIKRLRLASERGAELVEFAICMPLLLLIIAGIIDFAFLFQSYEVTTNAAREGARLAVLPGYNVNNYAVARQRVSDYIRTGGAQGPFTTQVTVEPLTTCASPGSGVRVTVNYTHNFLILGPVVTLLNGGSGGALTYATSSLMRSEIQALVPCP